ncbi:hypothetical protein GBAR_LOCUS8449 [Geodia barretti]|uniref:Uncharacterized protein n=1 Tax=Geodia barretti TaxID=519541 RepID=A0AA35RLF9_GEOBA|nr:hypothetical protein GBAR_LOCUS8449 [Geodia barretti]
MHMMTWTNTILPQLRIFPSFIYTYTRNYSLYACALQNQHTAYYSAAVRRRAERPIMSLEERLGPTLTNLLPTAPILISLAGHFILVNFAMLATMTATSDDETGYSNGIWLPLTYIFYNIIFFQLGIWTLQKKNEVLPVAVFIVAVVVSTISDVIMLAANYSNAIDYVDPMDSDGETNPGAYDSLPGHTGD